MGIFKVAFVFKFFSRYHIYIYYLYIYTHICIYVHFMLLSSESMFEVRPCYVVASACFQSVRVYLQTTTNNAQTTCYAKWTLWRISNCQLIQCQVDALCFLKLSTKKPGDNQEKGTLNNKFWVPKILQGGLTMSKFGPFRDTLKLLKWPLFACFDRWHASALRGDKRRPRNWVFPT